LARSNGTTIDATVQAIIRSWATAWEELTPGWQQAIAGLLAQYERTGRWPSPWQVARIEAVARAQQSTDRSLAGLLTDAADASRAAAATVVEATAAAEPDIITSQRAGLTADSPPQRAVDTDLAARQRRISALHRPIRADTLTLVGRVFTRPPTGRGVAGELLLAGVRAGFEAAAARVATIARTEPVDAYRATSALVHTTNRRVLTRWAWLCACDRRSCPACWVMHGRQFPLETLGPQGHGSCRCQRLPLTAGVTLPSAETRFRRLSRRDQLTVLGPGRNALYRAGDISWGDLARLRTDRRWRDHYVPTPLADLNRIAGRRTA
jgi:hypothetical protein